MSAEFLQAFSFESDIQGIFGVGAPVGEAPTLDIEFRPSLTALRAHAVIKQHIGPALKRADASCTAMDSLVERGEQAQTQATDQCRFERTPEVQAGSCQDFSPQAFRRQKVASRFSTRCL